MKKQIMIGIIAIVVVIVVILAVVFLSLINDKDKCEDNLNLDSRFFGEWEIFNSGTLLSFKSNGSLYDYLATKSLNFEFYGTWEVKDDQLCVAEEGEGFVDCLRFEFSNNDKSLTWYNEDDSARWILTKQ